MWNLQTVSGFLLGGTLLDIGVWHAVKDLQIYDKEDETGNTKKKRKKRRRQVQERTTQQNQSSEHPLF
jgi:predicted RNA-binding protein